VRGKNDFKNANRLIEYCETEFHSVQIYPGNSDEVMKFDEVL
jgi:hypothetical protein